MANPVSGGYGGPSSGWVQMVVFPRTTFESWPTWDTAAIPPDPPGGIAAVIAQQAASFRAAQVWVWTFEGGLSFLGTPVVEAPFDPAASGPAWTHGDRMRGRDQRLRFSENPPPWVPVPIFDPQLWPATQIGGGRMAGRPWRDVTQPPQSWLYTAFSDPRLYVAATQQEWNSLRVGPRRWYDGGAQQAAWVYTAFSDPTLFAAPTQQETSSFRLPTRGWWISGPPDTAWITTNLPVVFDAATYPPNVQLASGFRLGQTQEWISDGGLSFLGTPDVVTTWDPSTAGSWLHGDRTRGRTWWTNDPLSVGWFAPTLPVYLPQVEQLWRSYRLPARRWWTSAPTPDAWIYLAIPPFDPALYVPGTNELAASFRLRRGQLWFSPDQPPPAWIYPNLPPIVVSTEGVYIPIFRPRKGR